MSFEPFPQGIEQGIERFARDIEDSLKRERPRSRIKKPTERARSHEEVAAVDESLAIATEARRRLNDARRAKQEALTKIKPEEPDALIGYLADAPEVAENIRRLAYERRGQAFGNL